MTSTAAGLKNLYCDRYFNTVYHAINLMYLLLLLGLDVQYCHSYCGICNIYFQLIAILVGRLKQIVVVGSVC